MTQNITNLAKNPQNTFQALTDFKKSLSDPKQLATILKDTLFKVRFELHIDLLCLPKGKESPNHDYAILYRNQKDTKQQIPKETMQQLIINFTSATKLPIEITVKDVKKDGLIYNAVFLDIKPIEEAA
jgi:hypothetical protein